MHDSYTFCGTDVPGSVSNNVDMSVFVDESVGVWILKARWKRKDDERIRWESEEKERTLIHLVVTV